MGLLVATHRAHLGRGCKNAKASMRDAHSSNGENGMLGPERVCVCVYECICVVSGDEKD